jgi:hypothetical protein
VPRYLKLVALLPHYFVGWYFPPSFAGGSLELGKASSPTTIRKASFSFFGFILSFFC